MVSIAGRVTMTLSSDSRCTSVKQLFCRMAASISSLSSKYRRSEEHTSELQSQSNIVCRLLLEKQNEHSLPQVRPRARGATREPERAPLRLSRAGGHIDREATGRRPGRDLDVAQRQRNRAAQPH